MTLYEEICASKEAKPRNLKLQFLAQKESITEALDRGCTRMEAWVVLKNRQQFLGNYSTFCRYVQTQITNKPIPSRKNITPVTADRDPLTKSKKKFDWSPNYDPKELTG